MAEDKTLKRVPPPAHPDEREHRRQIAQAVSMLMDGRANNTFEATLSDGTASTTLDNKRLGPKSAVIPVPLTANAANLLRTSDVYISGRDNDQVTFTHGNTVNADQDFVFVIWGA